MFVGQQLGPDRALHSVRGGAHDLRRSARPDLLGTAQPAQAHRRARRLSRHRRMAFLLGLPPGHLDRRARPRGGARRLAAPQPLRPADRAHGPDAQGRRRRRSATGTRSACAARRRKATPSPTSSCRRPSPARARIRRCGATAGRSTPSPCRASMPVGVAAVALGIARAMLDAFIELAATKTPRYLGAAGRQSRACSRTWPAARPTSARRAPGWSRS